MRQAGRYMPEYRKLREKHSLIELCKTPELSTEVTLQPLQLGIDAAILFADILLPLEPMGASPSSSRQGEGPVIHEPITSIAQIDEAPRRLSRRTDFRLRPRVDQEHLVERARRQCAP